MVVVYGQLLSSTIPTLGGLVCGKVMFGYIVFYGFMMDWFRVLLAIVDITIVILFALFYVVVVSLSVKVIIVSVLFVRGSIVVVSCFSVRQTRLAGKYISQNCAIVSTCTTRIQYGEIGARCVKLVQDMQNLFIGQSTFNSDISNWDVSSVIIMDGIFYGASSFNSNISRWNVGRVTTMKSMFYGASSFNQNLCPWGPQLPSDFDYGYWAANMFSSSGCLDKNTPSATTGPWCAVTTCPA
jgi:surface protein